MKAGGLQKQTKSPCFERKPCANDLDKKAFNELELLSKIGPFFLIWFSILTQTIFAPAFLSLKEQKKCWINATSLETHASS